VKKSILPIIVAGVWITISEFIRNELLFKSLWVNHYKLLGLTFKTLPINGIFWFIWSIILAYLIYILMQKFSIIESLIISWLTAFIMMWLTIYNLQVLPLKLLIAAIPLSMLEVIVAGLIIERFKKYSSYTRH